MQTAAVKKVWRRSYRGYLVNCYERMERRAKARGLGCLSRASFYEWADCGDYLGLWTAWKQSDYEMKLSPTVDRIDVLKGYEVGNMQWLTHSENAKKGRLDVPVTGGRRFRGVYKQGHRWVARINKGEERIFIGTYNSDEEAARAYDRWAKTVYGRAINFPSSP